MSSLGKGFNLNLGSGINLSQFFLSGLILIAEDGQLCSQNLLKITNNQ